ncbi:hypothetical protein [Rhizobium leguminosarum]|jgi:hypothetical protein|uniref:hypothetical protein n=1 Tax=Rhizobium leguminosarum TaxID=384 RepID=UPI001C8FDCD2|nr:hypothetical protein [Rhizobium leguminosarum]MBY2932499.1 hypothetical protein [Rhizobium leguminosarum]
MNFRSKHQGVSTLPPTARNKELGGRPSVEVRTMRIKSDGKVEELTCHPLEYYGSCPDVGDTIVSNYFEAPIFYSVQRRYFVMESVAYAGWALIVREIDPSGPPQELWNEWQAATKFWEEIDEQEEQEEQQAKTERLEALLGGEPGRPPTNSSHLKHKGPKKRKLHSRGSDGGKPKSDG